MLKPPIPADEDQRLEDLRRLDMLLTTPEEEFDRVTDELARIFGVHSAMMSFIDHDTQYYKAAVDLPPDIARERTEPRELSVCSYVVGANRMLVVEDLLADERFRDNPIVLSSGARFYAGAPLRGERGHAIGTLCLVDVEPRAITDRERDLLTLVAEGVMAQVKLQVASRQLLRRTMQIERDLRQAVQMQRFLLPPARQEGEGWRISHLYEPYEHLGGDFVDVHARNDGRLAILVADVSGHGTTAALTVAMTKTAFHRAAPTVPGAAGLLSVINRELAGIVPPTQFMTAVAALFDPARRSLVVASAGHPHPLVVGDTGVEFLHHDNELVMLLEPERAYQAETTLSLSAGERLLIYTDGAVEARVRDGGRLGTAGLVRCVRSAAAEAPADFLTALMSRLKQEAKDRFEDDVALMSIESW